MVKGVATSILAVMIVGSQASGAAQGDASRPDRGWESVTPEVAIELGTSEQVLRLFIDTCVKDLKQAPYLKALSDRYLSFLVTYGRVRREDFKPAPHLQTQPECPSDISNVVCEMERRDASIAELLPEAAPQRPQPELEDGSNPAPASNAETEPSVEPSAETPLPGDLQ